MIYLIPSPKQVNQGLLVLFFDDVMLFASTSRVDLCFSSFRMDVSAGRDSTWRRTPAADDDGAEEDDGGAGGGMEAQFVPLELYDCARAKIEANLRWLFAKAYGIGKAASTLCLSVESL